MKIEILTRKQAREEIKKESEKREFKTLRLIDGLNKRLQKVEDELKFYRAERTKKRKYKK